MRFNDIVEHLGNRGFVTRESWDNKSFLFFGMDNIAEIVTTIKQTRTINPWTPCLADILADDWEIIQIFWNGSRDDFLPFQNMNLECMGYKTPI